MTATRHGALTGVVAALLVAAVAACGSDPTTPELEIIEESTFADQFVTAANDTIDFDLASMTAVSVDLTNGGSVNVYYQDLQVGVGDTAVQNDTVFFSYDGWVRDGTLFDSNQTKFRFFVGDVIAGIHFGAQGQQVGGSRLMVIPPELAYGYNSAGSIIYPGAIVLFRVQIDSIHAATP
jgi:FKBP-type peptidyl-prolyl cis-trans isomerase